MHFPIKDMGVDLTVREILDAAREAVVRLRYIDEQTEIRRLAIGVQGHSYEVHPKVGIFDSTGKIDDLIAWEQECRGASGYEDAVDEARSVLLGVSKVADPLLVEVAMRYYLDAESWVSIARDVGDVRQTENLVGLTRHEQVVRLQRVMVAAMSEWDLIGIARLKELGR